MIYYMQVTVDPEFIANNYSAAEQAFLTGTPVWATSAFALAVTAALMAPAVGSAQECIPSCDAEDGRFLAVLGGEHALTLGSVRAARATFGDIGVVQFDAHADLRDRYEGTPYSQW